MDCIIRYNTQALECRVDDELQLDHETSKLFKKI